MKLTIEMPWERDLSVNHCRMGPRGNWHIKPHVEAWMDRLAWETRLVYPLDLGRFRCDGKYQIHRPKGVAILVDFRFPNKRKIDDHNLYYVIANAVAKGLGIDDKDIRISTGTIEVDRANPGFTITVEDSDA